MNVLLWIVLPYVAVGSFIVGHIWRYRHDKFGWYVPAKRENPTRRLGSLMFRGSLLVQIVTWWAEFAMCGRGGDETARVHSLCALFAGIDVVAIVVGVAGLVSLLALRVAYPGTPARNAVDRMTLPVLAATLFTGIAVMLGTGTDIPDLPLFPWFRSVVELNPRPDIVAHASALIQLRAELVMLLIGIWPYTRLVRVFAAPISYLRRLPWRLSVARAQKTM